MKYNPKEKRKHIRHNVLTVTHYVALIKDYNATDWIKNYYNSKILPCLTEIVNVSDGGCFIKCSSEHVAAPNSIVYVVFSQVPGIDKFMALGKVKRTNWSNKHKTTGFAVEWLPMNKIDSDIRSSCLKHFRDSTLQKVLYKLISEAHVLNRTRRY